MSLPRRRRVVVALLRCGCARGAQLKPRALKPAATGQQPRTGRPESVPLSGNVIRRADGAAGHMPEGNASMRIQGEWSEVPHLSLEPSWGLVESCEVDSVNTPWKKLDDRD